MNNVQVGIMMGSKSDLDIMEGVKKVLDEFGVTSELRVLSAHRTPKECTQYAGSARDNGIKLIVAGAGGSAHLAGVVAAHTTLPVISIPVKRDNHDHEALWSNIALPPGIPVATMPENGSKNAALLAVEILALSDPELAKKYDEFRAKQSAKVLQDDASLNR
ncbi:5-(carboxyamino)imidazole ribonucleotide mutase [Candidatus Saccharibacteria bacterium RIFCSPHIGHO2_12_FULL_41_12]|nr:MAG: 5-(carboxyamino)imidazole ribonucleotide mutase [Candidatus Saccharibacteria bacterium RIFCSPHIGHO2_12_FULL_41_12]